MSDQLKVTVLGSGGSGGVPYTGNFWGDCDPNNPKNRRTRPSILLQKGETNLLIDTGPELREQLNRASDWNGHLQAVFYTHFHADHVAGIDDLRAVRYRMDRAVDIYSDAKTLEILEHRFEYAFKGNGDHYKPLVTPHLIERKGKIGEIVFQCFDQPHGDITTLGFRFGDFAYTTDVAELTDEAAEILDGVKVLICGTVGRAHHKLHADPQTVVQWAERIGAGQVYLTHMNAFLDYDTLCQELPDHVRPAYDGLEFTVQE